MTPPAWYAYAARTLRREQRREEQPACTEGRTHPRPPAADDPLTIRPIRRLFDAPSEPEELPSRLTEIDPIGDALAFLDEALS